MDNQFVSTVGPKKGLKIDAVLHLEVLSSLESRKDWTITIVVSLELPYYFRWIISYSKIKFQEIK